MTDHQGLTDGVRRVEGKTYYAVLNDDNSWQVWRKGASLYSLASYDDRDGFAAWAHAIVALLDRAADHHTTKAKEDERRRIDGLAETLDAFRVLHDRADEESGEDWTLCILTNWNDTGKPFRYDGETFTEALEAATQSTPKGDES